MSQQAKQRGGLFWLHPFLFGLYPVLFLAAFNKEQMAFSYIIPHILIIQASILVLFPVMGWLLGNRRKASVFLSGLIGVFFSYGHLRHLIEGMRIYQRIGPDHILLLFSLAILIGGYFWLRRTSHKLDKVIQVLNLVALLIVTFTLGEVILFKIQNPYMGKGYPRDEGDVVEVAALDEDAPDIYYIIPDRYPEEEVLRNIYHYDNSEFVASLRERDFKVYDGARANYHKTALSLASSLNMCHLLELSDRLGADYEDWAPFYEYLKNYKVQQYLQARNYLYIHMGSWWKPTQTNPNADINYTISSLSEFSTIFYGTTILYPIFYKLKIGGIFSDPWELHYRRVLYKFDQLAKIPLLKSPKFVFAHFAFPHPPYIFDRDGKFVPLREARKRERFMDQLTYANQKLLEMVDAILANSARPPVIILQSDEGPFPIRYEANEIGFSWADATTEELDEKIKILNAIYLPEGAESILPPTLTPVNTFRVLFSHLFQENFPLLPDHSYVVSSDRYPLDFIDVTDRLN